MNTPNQLAEARTIKGQGPFRIFDSRKARERYKHYKDYRSSDIIVPPNFVALVSIIAPEEYYDKMTFTAIRIPTPDVGEDSSCYMDCNVGKRYRRWQCQRDLGAMLRENGADTVFTEYNSSVVYWGLNPFTQTVAEFEYIVRPGTYFLQADRCVNEVLEDCVNYTIIEASLIYTEVVADLFLPCAERLGQYWTNKIIKPKP